MPQPARGREVGKVKRHHPSTTAAQANVRRSHRDGPPGRTALAVKSDRRDGGLAVVPPLRKLPTAAFICDGIQGS